MSIAEDAPRTIADPSSAVPGGGGRRHAAVNLPPEIGFLLLYGVPAAELARAAAMAREIGVTADRVVISRALVSEDEFYRALARHLDIPYLSRSFAVAQEASMAALRAGFVALAPGGPARIALAPEGAALKILLERRRSGLPGAAIAAPSLFRACLWSALGVEVMAHAASGISGEFPLQSARSGLSPRQKRVGLIGLASLVLGLAALGHDLLIMLGVMAGILFGVEIWLRLGAAFEAALTAPEKADPPLRERDLPVYTVVLALYREAAVARQLAGALRGLDYPPEKLDIKLMLEAGDEATKSALEAQDLAPYVEIVVCPPGEPRTKPRALNAALTLARGDLLVVYDAEDIPDPAQLRLAAARFARSPARLACLQARLVIDNTGDGILARFFTIEYAALFDVVLPGLARLGCPLPLGGTSNHFRVRALRDAMGWDAWNVTEDADLGLRLARLGYHVDTLASDTLEEAPAVLKPWLSQRARWQKGWMQTLLVHSREPRSALASLGLLGYVGLLAHTFGTVATSLAFPFLTALAAYRLWEGELIASASAGALIASILAVFVMTTGFLAILTPALAAVRSRALWRLLPLVPLLPFYYVLVSAAAWRALWELFRSPTHWNKTEHGLARTSRARPAGHAKSLAYAARVGSEPKRP